MNIQDKIIKEFPDEYNPKELTYGLECGEGWHKLIYNLIKCINSYTKNNKLEPIKIIQIKQKFGGLRFYAWRTDEIIDGMIQFAEFMSYKICENCGKDAKLNTEMPYVQTICDDCIALRLKEQKEKFRKYRENKLQVKIKMEEDEYDNKDTKYDDNKTDRSEDVI